MNSAKSGYLVVHSELQTHLAPFYKGAVDLILSPLAEFGVVQLTCFTE